MKYIYLYTTTTYQLKNWYKIGETISNPLKRIQSQDNASNPEPLLLVAYWEVNSHISDKQVHRVLLNLGFEKLRGNREWFELSTLPQQDVESALLELDKKSKPLLVAVDTSINIPVQNYYDIWWGNSLPHQIKQH